MKYDKLVRDKIPEIIKSKGGRYKVRLASSSEYWAKLKTKLQEEVEEFIKSESHEEIADVLEVLKAAADHKGYKWQTVLATQRQKARQRGGFKKKIILIES